MCLHLISSRRQTRTTSRTLPSHCHIVADICSVPSNLLIEGYKQSIMLFKREDTPSSASLTLYWAGSLYFHSSEIHHAASSLGLFHYWWKAEETLWCFRTLFTFPCIDGRVRAYFSSINVGAEMKCQRCDTNSPLCSTASWCRQHHADLDLIKMHIREPIYDFQAKWWN